MWPSKPHVNIDSVLEESRQILVFANHAQPWVAEAKKRKRAIKGGTSLHQSPKVMKENLLLIIPESGDFSADVQTFVQGLLTLHHTGRWVEGDSGVNNSF